MRGPTEAIDRLACFESVTLALATAFLPDEVGTALIKNLISAFGAFAGTIVRFAPDDAQMLEVTSALNYPKGMVDPRRRFPLASRMPIAECIRTRTPIRIPTVEAWRERYDFEAPPSFAASAAFPLLLHGEAVGAVGLSFDADPCLSDDELAFMISLGRQCALAFERARLLESEQRARRAAERNADRMARLQAVTALLGAARVPEEVAEVIISAGVAALGGTKGILLRAFSDGTCEMVRHSSDELAREERFVKTYIALGFPPTLVAGRYRFSLDAPSPLSEAIRTCTPLW
ncbi:MAG: GAF domain-containing protein, partial [Polyangiaceae bacterium]